MPRDLTHANRSPGFLGGIDRMVWVMSVLRPVRRAAGWPALRPGARAWRPARAVSGSRIGGSQGGDPPRPGGLVRRVPIAANRRAGFVSPDGLAAGVARGFVRPNGLAIRRGGRGRDGNSPGG